MIPLLKKTILILVISSSAAIAQTPKPTINDLSWLTGCWEANRKGREISEQWMKTVGANDARHGPHRRGRVRLLNLSSFRFAKTAMARFSTSLSHPVNLKPHSN